MYEWCVCVFVDGWNRCGYHKCLCVTTEAASLVLELLDHEKGEDGTSDNEKQAEDDDNTSR